MQIEAQTNFETVTKYQFKWKAPIVYTMFDNVIWPS